MAIVTKILFNNKSRTILKFVNTQGAPASTTVTLASLTAVDQTVEGIPTVSILGVCTSLDNNSHLTITRNSEVAMRLYGNTEFEFTTNLGCSVPENATHDLVIDFSHDGTAILELRKERGYTFGPSLATIGI